MPCPSCDSIEFGVAFVDNEGVVRFCASCEFIEEASQSEIAEFTEASGGAVTTGAAA